MALLQSAKARVPEPTWTPWVIGAALKLPPTFEKMATGTLAAPLEPLPLKVYQRSRSAPPTGALSKVNHAPWMSAVPGATRLGKTSSSMP